MKVTLIHRTAIDNEIERVLKKVGRIFVSGSDVSESTHENEDSKKGILLGTSWKYSFLTLCGVIGM